MIGETVTILTAGTIYDPYADDNMPARELPEGGTWVTEPSSVDVDNVLVGSAGSTEPLEAARDAVDSDFDLIFQPPVTVTPSAQDRIIVRGLTCDVAGRPFLWKWPGTGADAGLVVRVKIREG